MNEESRILTIKCCEECTFHVQWPDFFLVSDLKTCQKVIRYLYQFSWKNDEETFRFLNEHMPSLLMEGLRAQGEMEYSLRNQRAIAVGQYHKPEDRKVAAAWYDAKLRKLKKMPETVQKLVEWWGETWKEARI